MFYFHFRPSFFSFTSVPIHLYRTFILSPSISAKIISILIPSTRVQQSTGILAVNGESSLITTTTTLHPFNNVFSRTTWVSRYQKGKTSLDLNEARDYGVFGWQWHQLDHMQTTCTLLQTDNHTSTSSPSFYRLDALPDAQPTVSRH